MPDQIFENELLVDIYDTFDGERRDLDVYMNIVKEFGSKSVLDVGCGTGSFSCLLSANGFDVIGVDPAQASLNFARRKPNSDKVRWILGNATALPELNVDMAVMTGNVAQVFLTDVAWYDNIIAIRRALRKDGYIVFEVRDPEQKAWENWTPQKTHQRFNVPDVGFVEGYCDVISICDDLVSFRWTYTFEKDGQIIPSDSTLRFRKKSDILNSLEINGFKVVDIREAPDRPKQEFVFIAKAV